MSQVINIGYKFGLLYGYGNDLIDVAGISVFAGAYCGISWKKAGFDVGLIPAGIVTTNFRFDIDNSAITSRAGSMRMAPGWGWDLFCGWPMIDRT